MIKSCSEWTNSPHSGEGYGAHWSPVVPGKFKKYSLNKYVIDNSLLHYDRSFVTTENMSDGYLF